MPVQITVAGAASVVSTSAQLALSYVPPSISSISGGGATAASTVGGDAIIVAGAGFGPASDNGVVPVTDTLSPRFGRGGGGLSYGVGAGTLQATSCAVVSDSLIQCLAAPGTGKGKPWTLTVAGQSVNFTTTLQSYAAPTISSFSGAPATAGATGGGEAVVITGENFGANAALVMARYAWSASASQPKGALSNATYTATACAVTTPHFVLTCQTAPGAGAGLKWTLLVDGISSSTPSTSYAPPAITFVGSAVSTPITNAVASTVINVFGTNLGPGVSSIDSITYGPYTANRSSIIFVTPHTRLSFVAGPGVGTWPVVVTVLGQSSQITSANSSAASFSFLRPTVVSVQPRSFGTLPGSQEITVRGIALGVDDPLANTAIVFGNSADNTRTGLIVPTSATLLSGGQQQLTFRLPAGVGPNRAVTVAVYPRGSAATAATLTYSDPVADSGLAPADVDVPPVLVTPLGLGSFFSFLPPSISSIIASAPRSAADASFLSASTGCASVSGVNATFCGYLKLEISGSNFGPSTATGPPDSVLRS
jgi:hypothetical protein